jgi:hypothetical protein
LRQLLAAISNDKPVCILLDDAHWGDLDSAALLAAVLREPDAPKLLVVASFRTAEGQQSAFVHRLGEAGPATTGIAIEPLNAELSKRLLDQLIGDSVDSEQRDALVAEGAGNPFLLGELARSGRSGPLPSLAGALRERLEALLQGEVGTLFVRPERVGHDAIGAEHHHEPLLSRILIGESEARQIQQERHGCRAKPHISQESTAAARRGVVLLSPQRRGRTGCAA